MGSTGIETLNPVVFDQIVRQCEEIESLRQQLAISDGVLEDALAVNNALKKQLEAYKLDAERYRFHVKLWAELHGVPEEDVVAEIDAARKEPTC